MTLGNKLGRHAEVVPACFVSLLRRTVATDTLAVEPRELIDWTRPHDLSEADRDELVDRILSRLRVRQIEHWDIPSGDRKSVV